MDSSLKVEKPYVVGIDIGGTNTVFGLVDARGTVVDVDKIKTGKYEKAEDYVDAVCTGLEKLIAKNGGKEKVKGIGIGAPNGNYYTGTIEFAPNLPWKGIIPLARLFEERIGIPTALTNDANAAAIGEMTYGAARGMKNFIMSQWFVVRKVVCAVVVARAVWRLTALLQVWLVLHVRN